MNKCRLPEYKPDESREFVILFGTGGWSSYFVFSGDITSEERLIERANRLIPNDIKKHPGNEKVRWVKIYKFDKRIDNH